MKKNIYLILLLLFSIYNLSAQRFGDQLLVPKSPQSYAFEKYGNVPINMYTGSIDLKIPITSFDAGELNIPVLISYDSSGFIPHKKSDPAGMNWSLMAGGRITRKLNRIPDEYLGGGPGGWGYNTGCAGFFAGVKADPSNNVNAYNINGGTGYYNSSDWVFRPNPSSNNTYETHPDVFSFNAVGISGKFVVGNDGNVLVESDDPNIKVDLSQMAIYNYIGCEPSTSIITIIDGKGNKYIFGGDFSTYEITYPNVQGTTVEQGMAVINSFSLSKIITNTGNIITFNYVVESFDRWEFCQLGSAIGTKTYPNGLLISQESFYQQGLSSSTLKMCPENQGGFLCQGQNSAVSYGDLKFSFIKKSVLSSIQYGDYQIKINYKDIGYPIKEYTAITSIYNNDNEWVIDNIETYNGLNLTKKTTFSYSNFGGSHQRPFLTSLNGLDSNEKYSFEYYNTTNLPAYYTMGIDHWGYWNFKDTNSTIAPVDPTYNYTTGDYNLINTPRDPDPVAYNVALLSKIVYPTKGYSLYEYEPQYYNKRIEKNSASSFIPALTNNGGLAGGARIKKIKNYSGVGTLDSQKEYQYTTSLNGSTSSGILMNWPRYQTFYKQNSNVSSSILTVTSSNIQTTSLDSYNVGYSKVFEIEAGKGYTEYNFSSYETHPDTYASEITNNRIYSTIVNENDLTPFNLCRNFYLQGTDKSIMRGKILTQKTYTESDLMNPIRTEEYEYTDPIDFNPNSQIDNNKYVSINQISGFRVQGYKKYMNSSYLKKKTTKEFYSGNEVKTEQEYFYDATKHLNLTKESMLNSKSNLRVTRYKYPMDYVFPPLSTIPATNEIHDLAALLSNNIKNIPTEINSSIVKGGVEYITGGKLNYFEDLKLEKIFELETNNLIDINGFNFSTIYPTGFMFDSRYKEKGNFSKYDGKGNILEIKPADGITTCYIWGYNNQYPIAKVINATYQDISNVLGATTLTKLNNGVFQSVVLTDTEIRNMLSALQTNLPNAQVTLFTYKPLVGMTSTTDPKGKITYYEYDTFNRLKSVKDHEGKIISENQYHYKN
ncbi:hypothetical protein [Flavobacterium limi]|uniref:YD repeat-containing protein n=1 Tax=Flavobacterium limi TaxID=2045105 RepID=A0ABQ1USH6_9FLAO|nr:hypothetical protein [Flavobacterium limi]GGF25756.1 hypothetical protein GCM10011518_38890 [Flavobacterium limi]